MTTAEVTATADRPTPVIVGFEGPEPQRRLTVAFRIILLIPQIILGAAIGIAALAVTLIGWFAALFTGRLPDGIASFLTRTLQFYVRVIAYGQYLLTDRYPPFSIEDVEYPVEVKVAPGPLNRLAVLFRIILVIPAVILASLASGGAYLGLFIAWLILVISGRMPRTLFEALAAVFRYQVRLYAYWSMLTSAYPGGLFGDRGEEPPMAADPSAPPAFPAGRPKVTRLVLSSGAKRLIVAFIVLGVVTNAGSIALSASSVRDIATSNDLVEYQSDLTDAARQFSADAVDCQGSAGCLQQARVRFADAVATFGAGLDDADIPTSAEVEADRVRSLTRQVEDTLRGEAPQAGATLQRQLGEFDAAFDDLIDALRS